MKFFNRVCFLISFVAVFTACSKMEASPPSNPYAEGERFYPCDNPPPGAPIKPVCERF